MINKHTTMKRNTLLWACAVLITLFVACKPDSYTQFLGTWGVEKIEYYNIDYAGNPIPETMITYNLTPGDPQSGIDMIFREDKTGEMHDRSQDTLWLDYNPETQTYENIIICPDTTLVTNFTYSYDEKESVLYLNMPHAKTYMMQITQLTDNMFSYTNLYYQDDNNQSYVERSTLKRIDNASKDSQGKRNPWIPRMAGSFLTGQHNE